MLSDEKLPKHICEEAPAKVCLTKPVKAVCTDTLIQQVLTADKRTQHLILKELKRQCADNYIGCAIFVGTAIMFIAVPVIGIMLITGALNWGDLGKKLMYWCICLSPATLLCAYIMINCAILAYRSELIEEVSHAEG